MCNVRYILYIPGTVAFFIAVTLRLQILSGEIFFVFIDTKFCVFCSLTWALNSYLHRNRVLHFAFFPPVTKIAKNSTCTFKVLHKQSECEWTLLIFCLCVYEH